MLDAYVHELVNVYTERSGKIVYVFTTVGSQFSVMPPAIQCLRGSSVKILKIHGKKTKTFPERVNVETRLHYSWMHPDV